MAQKTNLNVSPYFDDFDSSKNFLKVLFKPGFPVQSRELTSLQSILQNQVEDFASHMFKEGSMVIPGNSTFDDQYYAVKLNTTQFGIDLSFYIDKFVGKTITGQTSGTTAKIVRVAFPAESSIVDNITLYVKYITSNENFVFEQFLDGEVLSCTENVTYGNTTINSGTPFATLIDSEATSIGSSASIDSGIYFIRGYFVEVSRQTIILDYYTNKPSYRVGLTITESLVSAAEDESLYDNAKGFTNYASPGADRLKISLTLSKKELTDNKDTNFVELFRVKEGRIQKVTSKTEYNNIRDYLAQRTFDESGSYAVDPFEITIQESLNNELGNNGAFFETEKTKQGNTPSEDLACLKIENGKVYVKGYDIEILNDVIDVEKPRDTEENRTTVPLEVGYLFRVNNVTRTPILREQIELHSVLKENTVAPSAASKIGYARAYTFNLTDSAYEDASTSWDLRVYDIQTFTKLTLNNDISLEESFHIKGKFSGATGYVDATGTASFHNLRQTSGKFIVGEPIIVNGIDTSVTTSKVDVYGIQDVKSFLNGDFSADSVLERQILEGGIATVDVNTNVMTASGRPFAGLKVGDIIIQNTGSDPKYNKITEISSSLTEITIAPIGGPVSGVYSNLDITGDQIQISLGIPVFRGSGALYTPLFDENISEVDLSNSKLRVIDQIDNINVDSTGIYTLDVANLPSTHLNSSNSSFVGFDQENYSFFYDNVSGAFSPASLSADAISIVNNNSIQIRGLIDPYSSGTSILNVTVEKDKFVSKVKNYVRSSTLYIDKSKLKESGSTSDQSLNDGLTYNQYHGLRVQDDQISLNVPDVVKVIAVYESLDKNNPVLDRIECTSTDSVSSNAIIGENIIGSDSKAVARVVVKPTASNNLDIVYLTNERFAIGETVRFKESNITTTIENVTGGSYKDISNSFILDKGQRDQYYDYSRLVRKPESPDPSRKLLVVFDKYDVPSNDVGDVFTVASYDDDRFAEDIPEIGVNAIRASDTLDFRPRVSQFTATDKSPFDFSARTGAFSSLPSVILAPDEVSSLSYEFYLPRIDRIYVDTLGNFIVDKGKSDLNPQPPQKLGNFMELALINMPAYLYNTEDASITLIDNRRYTMRDIGELEGRIENLEETTSLSLLELNTKTIEVRDSEGRDRFKSGFFVDNFRNLDRIDTNISLISVDGSVEEVTPIVNRNTLESLVASSTNFTPQNLDLSTNFELLDPAIQKTGNVLTLAYKESDWLEQPLATKVENINPFNVVLYVGDIELTPNVDTWVRQTWMATLNQANTVNTSTTNTNNRTQNRTATNVTRVANWRRRGQTVNRGVTNSSSTSTSVSSRVVTSTRTSVANVLRSSSAEVFMRSRNINVNATNLKPRTRYYQFLDNTSGIDFMPKMLEISKGPDFSISGASSAFSIGETVIGTINDREVTRFRLAHPRHKSGSFNAPDSFYNTNPYQSGEFTDTLYSSTSKVLNVDTFSMAQQAQGDFYGYAIAGMKLKGQTSGAEAYVKDVRLVSDNYGDLIGSFFLRDPNTTPSPSVRIRTGNKTYRLTSSKSNAEVLPGSTAISFGETSYNSTGTLEVWQRVVTVTTVRRTITTVTRTTTNTRTNNFTQFFDPLAQSFTVGGNVQVKSNIDTEEDAKGVFLTSVDLFFANIDENNAPVRVEVRTMELGTPTLRVIGPSVTIRPVEVDEDGNEVQIIKTSPTGDIPTNVKFPEPIFLEPGREYAIVLISENSDAYEVWTAVMGEKTVNSATLPDVDAVIYTQQFALGSLFKSQNGSIWTTDQFQDLKFKLYKAEFTEKSGTAYFYNPPMDISNGYNQNLPFNPISAAPKTGWIGIQTITDNDTAGILTVGRRLAASINGIDGSAIITGVGASVTGITTISGGENYFANINNLNVAATNISGVGTGLVLQVSTGTGTTLTNVSIASTSPGYGYVEGDVVTIAGTAVTTTSNPGKGTGARITISGIGSANRLYLSNVQGDFSNSPSSGKSFGVGYGLSYYSGNTKVSWASTTITDSHESTTGREVFVRHYDHGMYSSTNKIKVSNVQPDVKSTTLGASLSLIQSTLEVASSADLTTFEGLPVDGTNLGYLKVGNEIIAYDNVSGSEITIATNGRAIDGTKAETHDVGSMVQKYEFNGVSLRRINGVTSSIKGPIGIDGYYFDIDTGSTNGLERTDDTSTTQSLSFNGNNSGGGNNVYAQENILYTGVRPTYDIQTPSADTFVNGRIRTVSGTSVGASTNNPQVSFLDKGYQTIQLNTFNFLSDPRMICSEVNQDEYLTNLPRSKSFTTAINFNTSDKNVSPILNLNTAFTEFFSSRLNNPVSDFTTDNRVNSIYEDPHSAVYYSKSVSLANPATSLKVILSAYRHESADIRVLYSLTRADSSEVEQKFELFPGYENLRSGQSGLEVIDPAKNTGHSDIDIPSSLENEFIEYEYNANGLGLFTGFTIKIIMSGENQAQPPRLGDLRVLAIR
jgi:hypothetical protein|tara:strand:- start:608 stop:7987 length:7380 start_codon:yes stop_codon:yes gene_type:complete